MDGIERKLYAATDQARGRANALAQRTDFAASKQEAGEVRRNELTNLLGLRVDVDVVVVVAAVQKPTRNSRGRYKISCQLIFRLLFSAR